MPDKNYVIYHLHSDLSNAVTNVDSVTKFEEYIKVCSSSKNVSKRAPKR